MVAQPVRTATLELFPRQKRFVLDPARFPAYVGGIGSGKSFAGAAKVLASTHGHEVGWSMLPAARNALRRIGETTDTITYVSNYTRGRFAARAVRASLPPPTRPDQPLAAGAAAAPPPSMPSFLFV